MTTRACHHHHGGPTTREGPSRTSVGSALRRLRKDQRGASTVELVIATPVLLLLILLIAQFALYLHATHIAQAAASEALSAARVSGGNASSRNWEVVRCKELRSMSSGEVPKRRSRSREPQPV